MNDTKRYIPVLSIAGSDSSGGAGIQADIKTISAHGCYAMTAITAITAQNTTGVRAIEGISPDIVSAQIHAVFDDITPLAVKTGMLYSAEIVAAVAEALRARNARNIIVDPVAISTSGSRLISEDAEDVLKKMLIPLADMVTPNITEAKSLSGYDDPDDQAAAILSMGAGAVLLKSGDNQDRQIKTDILYLSDGRRYEFSSAAVDTVNTHGTGCTLSSAISSLMALGQSMTEAVAGAKRYIYAALTSGAAYSIGKGHGPVNHFCNTTCALL